jgi:hypothetical protein
MPGLDPGIHTDCRRSPSFIMDRRVKPGDDRRGGVEFYSLRMASEQLFDNIARLERELAASRVEITRLTAVPLLDDLVRTPR